MGRQSDNLVSCMRAAMTAACMATVLAIIALGATMPSAAAADELPPVPAAGKRLTDLAKVLNPPEQTRVTGKLKEIEEKTRAQVAVLVVETTQPPGLEEYALRVFDTWKLGQARVANGLLVLIAAAGKKVRIEVGRGLESAIPDAHARRIIDAAMVTPFRQGKDAAGILSGLNREMARIVADQRPAQAVAAAPGVDQFARAPSFEMGSGLLSLLVFVAIFIGVAVLSRMFGLNERPAAPGISVPDYNEYSSSSTASGSGGSSSGSDSNVMSSGGGESAGGRASASFGYISSSSSGSDSSCSHSGSSSSSNGNNN